MSGGSFEVYTYSPTHMSGVSSEVALSICPEDPLRYTRTALHICPEDPLRYTHTALPICVQVNKKFMKFEV